MDVHSNVVAMGSKVLLVDPYDSPLWEIDVKKTLHAEIEAELASRQRLGDVSSNGDYPERCRLIRASADIRRSISGRRISIYFFG